MINRRKLMTRFFVSGIVIGALVAIAMSVSSAIIINKFIEKHYITLVYYSATDKRGRIKDDYCYSPLDLDSHENYRLYLIHLSLQPENKNKKIVIKNWRALSLSSEEYKRLIEPEATIEEQQI